MKKFITIILLAMSLSHLINSISTRNNAYAQIQTNFICRQWQGKPTTIAQTAQGDVPIIQWNSDYFNDSGYTSERRCQEVSERFQEYYQAGTLKYLTTGTMNRQPVICSTQNNGGSCQNLLFTLKHYSDPSETLRNLIAVRTNRSEALNETNGRLYIDLEQYIQQLSQEDESVPLW